MAEVADAEAAAVAEDVAEAEAVVAEEVVAAAEEVADAEAVAEEEAMEVSNHLHENQLLKILFLVDQSNRIRSVLLIRSYRSYLIWRSILPCQIR